MNFTRSAGSFLLFMLLNHFSIAQTTQWKLTGNNLKGTEKLGSTNNASLDFITNNTARVSLTNTGNVRFPSDQSSIQFSNPGANPKPMLYMYESGVSNTSRMVLAYSPGFPTYGLKYSPGDKFDFVSSGVSVLEIDLATRRTGIGTTLPQSKLHVFNGSSGITPLSNSLVTIENSASNYLTLLTPSSAESGILFGNKSAADGGIVFNNTAATQGLQFRTGGNITKMVLTANGNLGMGKTLDPGIYKLRIDHANAHGPTAGLDIANTDRSTDWEFFTELGLLELFGNGDFKGSFNINDGSYNTISDERMKTNIQPMSSMLEKILRLKPVSYQFKNATNKQQYDGFIAQDVIKIFPSLVTHNVNEQRNLDAYTLNYSGFGVIAIKGIQELIKINEEKDTLMKNQQLQINELQKQNDNLQKQIDELKAIVLKSNQNSTSSRATINASITDALLQQNVPNPFTNSTTIHYTLPQKFATAQIVITDNSGKGLKQLNVSGTGKGALNIDASMLSSGTYNYSLIVDGKIITTRQMTLAK